MTTHTQILQVRGLRRHFGKAVAVDGLDLTAWEGEIYGFLGVNGAGKTTTIRAIMGIIAAQSGTITLMDETTQRTSVKQRQQIGYVSQDQHFYPWMTCRGIGKFVGSFYPTWDAPEYVRLIEMFEIPPDRRTSELSGGMRAKLALALALAPRPALLILDEPTASLDPVTRHEFMRIIVTEAREHRRSVFFSSHLIDEVEACADRIGIIHQGRMRFEGQLAELRARVRRLVLPANVDYQVPKGFKIWRDEEASTGRTLTMDGPADAWEVLAGSGLALPQSLSLEEIFLACVGSRHVRL